jgi:hypothetical protein
MLPYLSHLLQLLNVVYSSLLKRYYNNRILVLVRSYIYYINKDTSLLALKDAFRKTFTAENVCVEL